MALSGGLWFDGKDFVARTFYTQDGKLTSDRPDAVDVEIDLEGGYVVPPFGEAHTHRPYSRYSAEADLAAFRRDGVLYVQCQGALRASLGDALDGWRDQGVELASAWAPLTGSLGHVVELYHGLVDRGVLPGIEKDALDGLAYFVVDDADELDSKWEAFLREPPDFVKTYLQYSEEIDVRHGRQERFGHSALSPEVLALIVAKAGAAGLRVSCHVETAADFHHAVAAGVHEIAHLPGFWAAPGEDLERFRITEEDAAAAAKRGVVVVTTISLSYGRYGGDEEHLARLLDNHRANLELLRRHGVTIAVGSDQGDDTSVREVEHLRDLGVFEDAELLRMWCEATPRTIFPDRSIGRLVDGYEASLLVLEGDPLVDFGNVRRIRRRMKAGVIL